jgi:endonuclease G
MRDDRDSDLASRTGFDREFLGVVTPLPSPSPSIAGDSVVVDGSPLLNYEHFSLAMSASRRMARWVAWNIDGATLVDEGRLTREGLALRRDRRLRADQQILDDIYRKNLTKDRISVFGGPIMSLDDRPCPVAMDWLLALA